MFDNGHEQTVKATLSLIPVFFYSCIMEEWMNDTQAGKHTSTVTT